MADKALVNYIRDALTAGATEQQIRDVLKTQDWNDRAIESAFAEAKQPAAASFAPRATSPPLAPTPTGIPWETPARPLLRKGAPFGFALAFAGGLILLLRVISSVLAGTVIPLLPSLAATGSALLALLAILIVLSSVFLKAGKFKVGGILAIVLAAVTAIVTPDTGFQLAAAAAIAGGALGLAKQ